MALTTRAASFSLRELAYSVNPHLTIDRAAHSQRLRNDPRRTSGRAS
jgi:hypothetical protein